MSQTQIQTQSKKRLVLTDTDLDGLSGAVNALLTWRDENPLIYAHFKSPQDTQPGTQAAQFVLQDVLNYLNVDVNEIVTIDIPPPRELPRRAQIVSLVQQLRNLVVYTVYDVYDHAEPEYWSQLRAAGANLRIVPDGYSVKLMPAIDSGKRIEPLMERWALLGSIADFDESVANKTPLDLERVIAEEVDSAYKFGQWPIQQPDVRMYGRVGALAKYIVERLDADVYKFISMAQEIYNRQLSSNQKLPQQVQYRRIGAIVVVDGAQAPQGLQWKLAWKATWQSNSDVAVVYNVRSVRGNQEYHGVIIASYWRAKSRVAPVVDQVVSEIANKTHASVVGHSGARSLMWPAGAVDTLRIAEEIATMLNQRLWTPSVTHLISDNVVASAVREDFAKIMTTLTQILENMQRMYQESLRMYNEYLELKRRQVELLERTTTTPSQSSARRYD